MISKRRQEDIPIKIGGWDGKFVYEKPVLKDGYELVKNTRGSLTKQQWQDGHKEVINKHQETHASSHQSETRSETKTESKTESTTTSSNTQNDSAKEHIVKIERCDANSSQNSGQTSTQMSNNVASQNSYDTTDLTRAQGKGYTHTPQSYVQNPGTYRPVPSTPQAFDVHGHPVQYGAPVQWNGNYGQQYVNNQSVAQQNASNAANLHGYSNETVVLPPQWDGKFPSNYLSSRPVGEQNTSNAGNIHGYTSQTEILPPRWDGSFPEGYNHNRSKLVQNQANVQGQSNASNFYGFSTEPTILPTQWDGKFKKSGETYLVPERNRSAANNLYGFNSEPVILPTAWNGKFELDPNDVRIKPERNVSDVRNYADHRNFVTRE